jgi:hypothetical protein
VVGIGGEGDELVTGGGAPDGTADASAGGAETPEDGGTPEEDASERDSRWERLRRWRPSAPVVIWAVIVAVLLGPLVWNWGKDNCLWGGDPLTPLAWDPLASKDLLDLKLVSSDEYKGTGLHQLLAIAPSCSTDLHRRFSSGQRGSAAAAREIVEFAEDHGWVVTSDSSDPDEVSVELEKPYGRRVKGARVTSDWRPGGSAVSVRLMWKWVG